MVIKLLLVVGIFVVGVFIFMLMSFLLMRFGVINEDDLTNFFE